MTYYEFLWRWDDVYFNGEFDFRCSLKCEKCPFDFGSDDDCAFPKDARFTNFNQLVKFAQGLRKAGLLK